MTQYGFQFVRFKERLRRLSEEAWVSSLHSPVLHCLTRYGIHAFQKWILWRHPSVVSWLAFKATGVDVSVERCQECVWDAILRGVKPTVADLCDVWWIEGWLYQLMVRPSFKDKTRWDQPAGESIGSRCAHFRFKHCISALSFSQPLLNSFFNRPLNFMWLCNEWPRVVNAPCWSNSEEELVVAATNCSWC